MDTSIKQLSHLRVQGTHGSRKLKNWKKTEYQEVYGEAIFPRNDSSKRPKQINISILVNEE